MNNLPPSNQKFSDWLQFNTLGDPQLEKAVVAAKRWVTAMKNGEEPRWLSLLGTSGVGKTHIANRLFEWARPRFDEHRCIYTPTIVYWPDFVQRLRSGTSFQKRDDMKVWPVLCLDDIGSERDTTGFASEELNTLLGCRARKWTILTSNLGIASIANVDARLSSRLIRDKNICIEINTRDFATR